MKEKTVTEKPAQDDLPHKSTFQVEEAVLASLTEEDVWRLSQESLTMKSWTGFRLCLVLLVQGCNQAGYGIDWAVIGGINAYDSCQLGTTATYFVFTAVGAMIIDHMRRRTMIFLGLGSMILFQTTTTITSWQYDVKGSSAAAALTILWIYLYQTFSALFIATMHNLYPIEILSLPLRAKGMSLYGTYGISVGIEKLGYKIWVVYIVYNTVQLVLSYFVFPETSKLNLEEIDAIFETPGVWPVKMSLDISKAKREVRAEPHV